MIRIMIAMMMMIWPVHTMFSPQQPTPSSHVEPANNISLHLKSPFWKYKTTPFRLCLPCNNSTGAVARHIDMMINLWYYGEHHMRMWSRWHTARMISSQKMYGLYGPEHWKQWIKGRMSRCVTNGCEDRTRMMKFIICKKVWFDCNWPSTERQTSRS